MAELLAAIPRKAKAGRSTASSADPRSASSIWSKRAPATAGCPPTSSAPPAAAIPTSSARTRLHLVEASASARGAQRATLGDVADRLVSSSGRLPPSFEGVLIANELLDALPVHQVVMRTDGLREVVSSIVRGRAPGFVTREGPLSTPALADYLERLGITLEPGWRVEINLRAVDWIREAARRLRRGFMILIDYGHEARELYAVTHAGAR